MDAFPLFSLTDAQRDLLLQRAGTRRFGRRETIFHAGDPGDTIFVIRSGHVAIRIVTEYGDMTTLTVLGPGDAFGELAVLSGGRRSATAVTLESTVLWTLSRAQLGQNPADRPVVDALFVQLLAGQVHRLTGQLIEALYVPVRHRLVRTILALCDQYGDDKDVVSLHITQDDVAGLTGATRPTVNQVLRTLEASGAISLHRGRIDVIDQVELRRHRG